MIYFNNSATSYPKPSNVIQTVISSINELPLEPNRSSCTNISKSFDINHCRKIIAGFFNIQDANDLVFTSGATESINLAILGLELKSHVITTVYEHNSVLRPLMHLKEKGMIELSIIEGSCQNTMIEAIIKAIKSETKLIVVSHVTNVNGMILDIKRIGDITRNRDILLLVDASQSAGLIPIDIEVDSIDLLAFTGHKYLYGTTGIGCLYINPRLQLKPLKTGGTGIKSSLQFQPEERPLYYESGTQNLLGISSLAAGINYIQTMSRESIAINVQKKVFSIYNELHENRNFVFYNQIDYVPSFNLSFNIKNLNPADVGHILEESFGIICRTGLHCAPLYHKYIGTFPHGTIRISPSFFTTDEEIKSLLFALAKICTIV